MLKKLDYGEVNPTQMTLTLANRSFTYPYEVLEDVFVKMDGFILPTNFVILDMEEDGKIPLIRGIPFLEIVRALTNMEFGELILRFQDDRVTFNVFEVMCHHNKSH